MKPLAFSGKMQEIRDFYKRIFWLFYTPARNSVGCRGSCSKGNFARWEKGSQSTLLGSKSHTLGEAGIGEPGRLSGVPAFPQGGLLWLLPVLSCNADCSHLVGLSVGRAPELRKALGEGGDKLFSRGLPAALQSIPFHLTPERLCVTREGAPWCNG